MTTEQSPLTPDDFSDQLRRKARRRSHFWPGSGFALLGYPGLAWVGTATIALMPATFLCLAFTFRSFFIWSIIASLVIYLCFYLVEQVACRSVAIYPGGELRFLSKFLVPVCAAGYVGLIGALVICFLNIGSMRIGGQGMMPTLHSGDTLLYRSHVFREDLRPGHFVLFRTSADSAWGNGGDLVVARILAIPGEELSVQGGLYLVNGNRTVPASPLGKYRPSLEIPQAPKTLTVPPGCYFIVQDDLQNSFDSRVLSWAKDPNLVATRAIVLTGHAFGKEAE
jgi:signal peptidase I